MRLPLPMSFGSLHINVLPDGLSTRPKNLNLMRVFTMRIVRTAVEPPIFALPEDKVMSASRTFAGNNSIMFLLLDGAYILDMTLFCFPWILLFGQRGVWHIYHLPFHWKCGIL